MHPAAEGNARHHHRHRQPCHRRRHVQAAGRSPAGSPTSSTSSRTSRRRPGRAPPMPGSFDRLGVHVRRAGNDPQRHPPPQQLQQRLAGQLAAPAREQRGRLALPSPAWWRIRRLEVVAGGDELRGDPGLRAARLQHRAGQRQHGPDPVSPARVAAAACRRAPAAPPRPIAASMPSQAGPCLSWKPRMPRATSRPIGRRRASSTSVASRTSHATGWSRRRASSLAPRGERDGARRAGRPRSLPRPCTRRHASSGSCTTAASGPNRRTISSAHDSRPWRFEPGRQGVSRGEQMAHVIGCVLDLHRGQRALRPVGESLGVVQLDAHALIDHPLQGQRAPEPGEARRQLDVEDVLRMDVVVQPEARQIRSRRVHHAGHAGVGDQRGHRFQRRALERVDHRHAIGGGDLREAESAGA